jgi:hypothetical protein
LKATGLVSTLVPIERGAKLVTKCAFEMQLAPLHLGPADYNFDETMSTLRYANRAKNIKNKPKINEDPKDAMLREFQEEIARLKARDCTC